MSLATQRICNFISMQQEDQPLITQRKKSGNEKAFVWARFLISAIESFPYGLPSRIQ